MYYLRQCTILTNLVVVTLIWLTCSFDFYLIQFLVNTFEQVYLSGIGSSLSDLLGYSTGGILSTKLGVKGAFLSGFTLATCGGLVILFYGLAHQSSPIFPVLVLVAKYGIGVSFNTAFVSHNQIFPVLFAATAMGYCNMFARLFSAGSSIFANLEEPIPMLMFTGTAAATAIASLFLRVPKQNTRATSLLEDE